MDDEAVEGGEEDLWRRLSRAWRRRGAEDAGEVSRGHLDREHSYGILW